MTELRPQTQKEIAMDLGSETTGAPGEYAGLHFIDGTSSQLSYAVVARRGHIFLGVRFLGLADGDQLGVPGKTYLHARVRSARDQALADKLDLEGGPGNVISLFPPQLALDEAWPGLAFEKIDTERASLILGIFINGSLIDDTDAVIARIEEASLFRKLVDCVIDRAGPEHSIARAKLVAAWMFDQAKPSLAGLKKAAEHQKIVLAAQKEFAGLVEGQVEVASVRWNSGRAGSTSPGCPPSPTGSAPTNSSTGAAPPRSSRCWR
jgi:hypothetical protein